MNTLKTTSETIKTLTIHTTLFDMLAAMQEDTVGAEADSNIVSTVAEWMQSNRISSAYHETIRSAA